MARDYPTLPRVGVGVVLLRGDAVLLIRRGRPPRLGEWSLPGGAQELGETVEEAARRELAEEVGLAPSGRLVLLDVIDSIQRDPDGRVRFHWTLIDFAAEAGPGEPVPGDDCAGAAWVPLADALADPALWRRTREVIQRASRLPRPIG
ncbi:NUDIX domain-containing protein [Elioraea sp. Yellowstone]|uniref:NUDIX hydrolase n=1 Tax=Elioraea sp. Yellowstone TaxID=2592070 RepID=UPI00114DD2DA|nr:NUDIX domain-containing protein [Elioraea sp. Yellowstone]